MKTVSQFALERLENPDGLRKSWIESRHATRDLISGTIALNVLLVTMAGVPEELERLRKCLRTFDAKLRKQILDYTSLYTHENDESRKLLQ